VTLISPSKKIEYRDPVFTGRFHTDIPALVFNQPIFEFQDRIVEGGETLLLVRRFYSVSGFNDRGNKKRFVNIDATAGLINNFHSQNFFQSEIKKPLTVPSHI